MSNQLTLTNIQVPNINLPQEVLARVQEQFSQAAANTTSAMPRLSFGGKSFNITVGNDKLELQDRVLDVHIVAIDPQFHYQFFEKSYDDSKGSEDKGRMMSRYPLPTDDFSFTPTHEWAQRAYKQRAVVMLANDSEHKLYVVDFGYNSIKKVGNPQMGLLNLSQLVNTLDTLSRNNQGILPFMFTVQLSFTREVQPEIQFSLYDQRQQGNTQARFATPAAMDAIVNALSSGEVDNLMKIEFDSADINRQAPVQQAPMQQAPVQQAPMQQAPVQQAPVQQVPVQQVPVQQAPVQQAPVQQAPVQQAPVQQVPVQQASYDIDDLAAL